MKNHTHPLSQMGGLFLEQFSPLPLMGLAHFSFWPIFTWWDQSAVRRSILVPSARARSSICFGDLLRREATFGPRACISLPTIDVCFSSSAYLLEYCLRPR